MASPELWGGLYQAVADMATDAKDFHDPAFDRLHQLEQAKTAEEVFAILTNITPTERDRLNSPLLDILFNVNPMEHICTLEPTRLAFLMDRGASVNACYGYPLHQASMNGDLEMVNLLLDRGADIHAKDDLALQYAAGMGHKEVVLT